MARIASGRLTDANIARIERETGMSAGQLALLAGGKSAGGVQALLDGWAQTMDVRQPAAQRRRAPVARTA
jgi:hypothetical protein